MTESGYYKTGDGRLVRRTALDGTVLAPDAPRRLGKRGQIVGSRHGEAVGRRGPTKKTLFLMKCCLRAANAGGWKDGRIAEIVAQESGLPIKATHIQAWKTKYPRFREQMQLAQETILDKIESRFVMRALDDNDRGNFKHGIAILKSRRAEFREKIDVNQTINGEVRHLHIIAQMSPQEIEASLIRHMKDIDLGHQHGSLDASRATERDALPGEFVEMDVGSSDDDRRDAWQEIATTPQGLPDRSGDDP